MLILTPPSPTRLVALALSLRRVSCLRLLETVSCPCRIGSVTSTRINNLAMPSNSFPGLLLSCYVSFSPAKWPSCPSFSAGTIPIIASYGTISLLRLLMTSNDFKSTSVKLGRFRKPIYVVTALFNGFLLAVSCR